MTKILILFAVLLALLLDITTASTVRRRVGGGTARGDKKGVTNRRTTAHSARHLMAPPQVGHYSKAYNPKGSKGSKGKGKGGKGGNGNGGYKTNGGRKGYNGQMKQLQPKCRPVVEGAEFIIEGAITMTMANMTEDSSVIGTEFVYNGPLLEFNDRDELTELENFFLSGSCTRTQERDDDMPGAGHCSYTITLDTGATMNFGGEAFDGWDNLMAITGGSQELIGLSGTVTLIGLNDDFEDTSDDFFSVPWIYGEAVLVYSICPAGYWDRYYIDDHDALPPPSIPDPFQRNQPEVQEVEIYHVVPADDHYPAEDDGYGHAEDDDYNGYY